MDLASVIGLVLGFGLLALGYSIDGGKLMDLWLLSALIITGGGTLGSVIMAYGFSQLKNYFKLFLGVFKKPKSSVPQTIDFLVKLSETARKEGLLSLEKVIYAEEAKQKIDPLLKRGILMVIDGTDQEEIAEQLQTEISVYEQKQKLEITMFDSTAGFAPAFGMVGTIIGLIQVLQNMEDVKALTTAIGVAFITTLYGVVLANSFFVPAANKLRVRLSIYILEKEMIIEGICAIRNGINPKMLRERLSSYLQLDSKRAKKTESKSTGG